MNDFPKRPDDQESPTLPPTSSLDEATLPPQSHSAADEATLPPTPQSDAGGEDFDTLPSNETAWRAGGKIRYFGDYELIDEIARGGMGVVYRAKQTSLNRIVALKMILAGQLAGEQEVQRFHAEAEAAANLDHPGIVPIYEVGEVEGQHYFSMGYVDGASLSDLIAEKPLEPRDAAHLTLKIAEAIAYAHEQGVIHRDLKPANVLVQKRSDGSGSSLTNGISAVSDSQTGIQGLSPRVTDFGLAKQVQGDDQLTASGQILGTPSYMPPEQASGKIDEIDHRADIYSVGGILYALITGRPPFQAANQLDTLMQVLEKEPVPPRQLDPKLPRDLETIALKALEKDPKRRYQTAGEMANDLTRFLNGEPIQARSITTVERAWRWAKRKPIIAGLGALAAALLLVVSIGGPIAAVTQAKLRGVAEDREKQANQAKFAAEIAADKEKEAKQEAIQANDALREAKEKAERTLYARTISLAYQAFLDDNVMRAEDLLNKASHEYRDWEWDFLSNMFNAEEQTLHGHQGIPLHMRLSTDGTKLVSLGAVSGVLSVDPNVYLWDVESGRVMKKLPYRGFAISPDAKRVALEKVKDGPVVILDVASEKEIVRIPAHGGGTAWANFSDDGNRLVTRGPDDSVRVWDATSGKELLEIKDVARRIIHDVDFSPDGNLLVWKTREGLIQVHDANTGKKVYDVEDQVYRLDAADVAISPDNKLLAAASDGPINLFELKTGKKIASLYGHRSSVLALDFHPDGRQIVSSGVDGTVRVWDVAERRESFRYRGHKFGVTFGVYQVKYSEDGEWIISAGSDTTIKIWRSDAGDGFARALASVSADGGDISKARSVYPDPSQEKDWLTGGSKYIDAVAFSPDGKWIAAANEDNTVRVYDAATRENTFTFEAHEHSVAAVAFHPNGNLIASGTGGLNEDRPGKILVWEKTTGKVISFLKGHSGPIANLIYHPDGKLLFSAMGSQKVNHRGEVFAWDIENKKLAFKYDDIKGVRDMAMSPDGSLLALASYSGGIRLLDTSTGELRKTIGGADEYFFAVAFSKDGKRLITGKRNWAVSVWDVESGKRTWEKIDHTGVVLGVAFNASGTRVISNGIDRTTKVWDATSGDLMLDLRGDSFEYFGVAVSPDGNTIASYGEAPYVTLWSANKSDGTLDPLDPDAEWPVILADDFEREQLGEDWTISTGDWEIENGAAKGVIKMVAAVPGYSGATIISKEWMPSTVEIAYDAWATGDLLIGTKLHDESAQDGIASVFLATYLPMFNNARKGGSILVQAAGGYREVARTGSKDWFQPNQKYHFRTVRRRGKWEMFIDDEPVLEGKVPETLWAPYLYLEGSFAQPGTTLYIDNLVVRAPESTKNEVEATKLEYDLRQELKLKSLVIQAIENKGDISDQVRQLALRYAGFQKEDSAKRKEIIHEMLVSGERTKAEYGALIEQLEEDVVNSSGAWEARQTLAMAHYRVGDFDASLGELKKAERAYQDEFAMSHPINMAILALVSETTDQPERVSLAMDRLTELMRSEHWQQDQSAVGWYEQVVSHTSREQPDDVATAADVEAIKSLTFDPMQRALLHSDTEPYVSTFSEDAIHIEGRSATANSYDVEVPNDRWVKAERLFQTGATALHAISVRNRADVTVDGDKAILIGEYTTAMPYGHWRWHAETKLRKTDNEWKIVWERRGITGFRLQTTQYVQSPSDWAKRDADVESARKNDDRQLELRALTTAFRRKEAFELAKQITKQDEPAAFQFASLANQAYSVRDPDEMLRAGRKAVELDARVGGLPFIRALAVEELSPAEPVDIGEGVRVRIPEFFPDAPPRDFGLPGKVLRGWYPTDRSAIAVFFAENGMEEESLEAEMDGIAEQFKSALKVAVHRQTLREVDSLEATDLIVEGAGSGRALGVSQPGAKGTIQRWVVAARGKDLIGFLLTSSSAEFDQRNTEFETWLQHVEIDNN